MQAYQDLLRIVLEKGRPRSNRTGTEHFRFWGAARFDLRPDGPGFPLLTTKKLHLKSIIHELLLVLRGETNIRYPPASTESGSGMNGPTSRAISAGVYGAQWRDWRGPNNERIDQIEQAIEQIKTNPDSRRLIVTAWNRRK